MAKDDMAAAADWDPRVVAIASSFCLPSFGRDPWGVENTRPAREGLESGSKQRVFARG